MMAYAIFVGDGNDYRSFNLPSVPTRDPIVIRDTTILPIGEKYKRIIWESGSSIIKFGPDEPKLELGYNLIVIYDTEPKNEEIVGYM